jgi:hypothetical protein
MLYSYWRNEHQPITGRGENGKFRNNKTAQMISHEALKSLICRSGKRIEQDRQRIAWWYLPAPGHAVAQNRESDEGLGNRAGASGRTARANLAAMQRFTGDVQALSHELLPSILDNLGLVTAVRSFCREISEQSGTLVDFSYKNVPDSFPREVSLSLFLLIQEALHNSVKYSGENRVQVYLQGDPSGIELEVRDRGVGFDVANVKNKGGLGLVSMRERIELLNGTIHVARNPTRGPASVSGCLWPAIRMYGWPLRTSLKAIKMTRIRILLADDHTLFCNLLRDLLELEYEVVGSVPDGRELREAAETLRPDRN